MNAATKAEALQDVRARLRDADVPPFVFWTVDDWRARRGALVAACLAIFDGARLAVRSATRDEDRPASGLAGHYRTELDVAAEPDAIAGAVDRVVAAYPRDGRLHHVLVQAMVRDVRRSGVVATRDPETGAPYDVIELTHGPETDLVTSGRAADATRVAVFRGADAAVVARADLSGVLRAVRSVEAARGHGAPVEIELAERRDGTVAVLQVRPLAVPFGTGPVRDARAARTIADVARTLDRLAGPRPALAGSGTLLGLMPDWNPAELIGAHPRPLAASLFRTLVGDATWQEARASMGYQPVPRTPLVRLLAGRPYVDVRASFNSFVPAGLARDVRASLVDAWLTRLRARPELHDRVELEVAETVLDFRADDGDTSAASSSAGRAAWRTALRDLTARAISLDSRASLPTALRTLDRLAGAARVAEPRSLAAILRALASRRVDTARPFAVVARHAFMAERLLRSAVERGVLTHDRVGAFRHGLVTVAGRFADDWRRVAQGGLPLADFLAQYGRLRPGTFDVTSLPYALRDAATWREGPAPAAAHESFALRVDERRELDGLLAEARIAVDADTFVAWARAAIVGRENGKFRFARALSVLLEALVDWGARHDLTRADLSFLTVGDLTRMAAGSADVRRLRKRIAAARVRRVHEREVRLGPLIRDAGDLALVWEPPVRPTFVTDRRVAGAPVRVDGATSPHADLAGKIVCIESADPGFDWILARGVGGLVTRFGGANSHMAVRCRELDVAAALGVGERVFERVVQGGLVELRCGEGVLRAATAGASCAR